MLRASRCWLVGSGLGKSFKNRIKARNDFPVGAHKLLIQGSFRENLDVFAQSNFHHAIKRHALDFCQGVGTFKELSIKLHFEFLPGFHRILAPI